VGVIVQELSVRGDKGGKKLPVVFDSSASRSLVRSGVAAELSTPRRLLIPRKFVVADEDKVTSEFLCDLVVEIGGRR
jgi:hypothetical protein